MAQEHCKPCDFGVFLALWNGIQNYTTPSIHFHIATWLQKCWERGDRRLVLQAFRASGKSTIAGLFSAWLLYRDPDLRILVLSAESSLSKKMVRTIRKIVEKHPLLYHLKPHQADEWAVDGFTVNRTRVGRDPSVLARGLYANTTGTRADIIICDDVEVPNTCDTADKREKLRERLTENNFILVPGGLQIYIGTPHTYYSIYATDTRKEIGEEQPFLKGYRRMTLPVLKKNGKSAWPERYPPDEIEKFRLQSGPGKFASQMMLEPVNLTNARLDPAQLKPYDTELVAEEVQRKLVLKLCGKKLVSSSAWWDPAFGSAGGDSSVLAIAYTDEEGHQWLHRVCYLTVQGNEDEATLQCRLVAQICKSLYVPSVTVETNGIGKFLPAILRKHMEEQGTPCAVLEFFNKKAKTDRILEAFETVMAAKSLHVHASVYETPFIREMQEWRPSLKSARDDGLDAAAGALWCEPVRIPRSFTPAQRLWYPGGGGHTAKTDFNALD
jgi:hypothetical protein